ncbi:MAG: thiosulfate oxidation carrier protein SoxY [Mesorhizobium sp.]|nr:thiosulfate oxidation carrier protein SoxY [Mesorhizobium sp.]
MTGPISRRRMLGLTAAAAGLALLPASRAMATPDAVADEIATFANGQTPQSGKIRLLISERVENGSAVPVTIEVDSAMEGDDRVESIMLLGEENPKPIVATFHFSALSGAALVSTRVRLAATQKVIAVARMADGSVWRDERDVDVAIGGCVT